MEQDKRNKSNHIRIKSKIKNLRILAGFLIFVLFIFMVIALFQQEEEPSGFLNQFEFYFDKNWSVILLDGTTVSETDRKDYERMEKLVQNAVSEGKYQKTDLPYTEKSKPGDILIFKNTIQKEYSGLILGFSFTGSNIRVILDGALLYQNEFEEITSEKLHENNERFVKLPNILQEGELWIELTSPYPDAATLSNVKIKTDDMVLIGVFGNDIADICCCLLIVIMAVIIFVLALIRRYTSRPSRGELFLGMTELLAGLYYFIGTDTLSIFYDLQEAYVVQKYLVLMIPIFLVLYFERNLYMVYPRRFFVLFWSVILNAAVQIFLQILAIQDIENMKSISDAAEAAVCVAVIVSLIQFHRKNKHYQTIISVFSIFILLSGIITDWIINRSSGYAYYNTAGQYSMTVFSIVMAAVHVLQLTKEYQAQAEKSAYLLKEKVKATEQQNLQLAQAKKEADAARQEALAANEAKGKFLARMSHEIRTPINAVLGMDEMILRESKEQNIKEYAMDIYTAGQTLLSLINDILDFSKIDSGKMEVVLAEYDISSLVYDLTNMISQRAKKKNIRFEVEVDHAIPSRLYGDDVHIRQILTNILTNAIKYTHEGTVWLRVKGQKINEMAVLKFEIEDTGIGIKEEDLPKLSAEFERIEENKNRNIEGTGLGMSITIQLLKLLNSKLQVESIYGEGSKFYFELEQKILDDTPIGDFESRVQKRAESYHYSAKLFAPEAKILVVDDNAVNRKVLRNLLKETQVQITDAQRGIECLELVQKNHYDLIFLDHMMPEMDGVETLHHIKELPNCPCQDTPIIVLTANAVSGAKEKYLSEGFDDFLSKPIVPEKLENMIKKMLPEELLQKSLKKSETVLPQIKTDPSEELLERLPQVDGLDWHYAWLHLKDMELLEYTIKEFYAQIDSAADNLEQVYKQITKKEQLEQYRIQVHAMKSLAATVGILPLSGIAKILEYAARDGKIDVLMSITAVFLEEWRSYRQKLQGVFGIAETAKKEVTDFSVILALVEMVRISVQDMDIDQADQLIDQLQQYEYSDEIGQNIRKLAETVTNLDSKEANRIADLLIEQIERV